ncbi:MAG: hypothetical protein ACXVHM_03080 [Methanobacterium sp.]
MIEILNFKEIKKGYLESKINIKIKDSGMIINKIGVFNKNGSRWISFPQETYEDKGEKKYFPLVKFDDPKVTKEFQDSVLEELDKFCNKESKLAAPSQQEGLPF